jgi:hypothetical protein
MNSIFFTACSDMLITAGFIAGIGALLIGVVIGVSWPRKSGEYYSYPPKVMRRRERKIINDK